MCLRWTINEAAGLNGGHVIWELVQPLMPFFIHPFSHFKKHHNVQVIMLKASLVLLI